MGLVSIELQPGVRDNGTILQSKGRFYATNLVRWVQGVLQAIGGWQRHAIDAAAVVGAPRALLAWKDNSGNAWVVIGTSSHLYVVREDLTLHDITPAGFTAGSDDASLATGFGAGLFGSGDFGTPRTSVALINRATVWDLDTWGEYLVGLTEADGRLWEWQLNVASDAAVITNAPTGCDGLVVTPERFLFALKGRSVIWCDQGVNTTWTPSATNQAGDYDLQTSGTLLKGIALRGRTLLLTDDDAWIATYSDPVLVYGFERVGRGFGVCSKRAAVATSDDQVIGMSRDGFWRYAGGTIEPIPCDVHDHVFDDINIDQISKATATNRADKGECWFFYPSAASNENDLYAVYNYRENFWFVGAMARLSAIDRGVFPTPLMMGSDGHLYQHETGRDYDGASPYAETGPILLAKGDRRMEIQRLVPDERTQGEVSVILYGRDYPNDADTTLATLTMASPTEVLVQARLLRVRYVFDPADDGRVGDFQLDIIPGDPLL